LVCRCRLGFGEAPGLLLDAQGAIVGEREFPHSGKGLSERADWILSRTGISRAVAVAVEVPHGPVVDILLDRGFIVQAINPKQLDRLRDRFSVAGAKDDRRDAYVSADGLRTDYRHLFRRLQIAGPRLIELRTWLRLAEERVRLSNRLHQQLWRYYPRCWSSRPTLVTEMRALVLIRGSAPKRRFKLGRQDADRSLGHLSQTTLNRRQRGMIAF
jgi:hypothetical protein